MSHLNTDSPASLRDAHGDGTWPSMMRFLAKALLFCVLLLAGHLVIAVWPTPPIGYLSAVADKQERLVSLGSPKLVFVGGSNLSFGIDSGMVSRELELPVANMGLGIYAGLRFMLDSVSPRLGQGDVVVLSPEYQFFYGLFEGDEELFDVLEAYPEGVRFIRSPRQAYMLARASLIFAKLKLKRLVMGAVKDPAVDCIYCRAAFDSFGDLTAHLDQPSQDVSAMPLFRKGRRATGIDQTALKQIERFASKAKSVGARVVVVHPPLPQGQYEENRDRIQEVSARLSNIEGLEVLAAPEASAYPASLFFDWVYHLDAEGRRLHTERIIELLRSATR